MTTKLCLCGSSDTFPACCEPVLEDPAVAETPEALMRARYSAFCLKDIDFIFETTDSQTRGNFDMNANKEWAEKSTFLKLEVLRSEEQGNKGLVEFKAHFKMGDEPEQIHHEIAKFRQQGGQWYFRDGKLVEPPPAKK